MFGDVRFLVSTFQYQPFFQFFEQLWVQFFEQLGDGVLNFFFNF